MKASWTGIGFSHHSVPSLSNTASRSSTGTASATVCSTKSTIVLRATPSRHFDNAVMPLGGCRCGDLDFLKSLVRGLVSLSGAAELGKPLRHGAGFGNGSQDSQSRLPTLQVFADALPIAGVKAEVLVVE